MTPLVFDLKSPLTRDEEARVVDLLMKGALMVYPTDTLHAVGCRALDGEAVQRLRAAKGRHASKAFPVIAANAEQALSLARDWSEPTRLLAATFWPGPLTLIVDAAPGIPRALLAGEDTIAVRVPDAVLARQLAERVGPLVSTSANPAGSPPCIALEDAIAAFPQASLAFDGGPLDGAPSTIVDARVAGAVRIVRHGRVDAGRIEEVLGGSAIAHRR
jgi:L-threonylcarbamoyladenylate synthase